MLMSSSWVVLCCSLLISTHVMQTPVTTLQDSLSTQTDTIQNSVAFHKPFASEAKNMADNTKLYAFGGVGIGALFLYSAVKGRSVLGAVQAAVQGKAPSTSPKNSNIVNPNINIPAAGVAASS